MFSRCSTEIGVVWRRGVLRNRREFANEELNETTRGGRKGCWRGCPRGFCLRRMFILSSTVESRNAYETKSGVESKLTRDSFSFLFFLNYSYD